VSEWWYPTGDLHVQLRDAPDDAQVIGWAEDFTDCEHVTYAPDLDGLRKLAAELNASCQGDIDPAYLENQVLHEHAHAEAARATGFAKVRYGMYVRREREGLPGGGYSVATHWRARIEHAAPWGLVTKLAYARIVAAPCRLSAGDEKALREMGYRDAEDVRDRLNRLKGARP
jgi:hypothetical protein